MDVDAGVGTTKHEDEGIFPALNATEEQHNSTTEVLECRKIREDHPTATIIHEAEGELS